MMAERFLARCLLVATCVIGAGHAQTSNPAPPFPLPVTFQGNLPCADCPGIRVTLTMYPDGSYFQRYDYLERKKRVELGRWHFDQTTSRLTLHSGTATPELFRVIDEHTIRQLDRQGQEIQSKLNFDLKRTQEIDRFHEAMRWRGMYVYMADAGVLTECLTGRKYPVPAEGAAAALEKAYLAARTEPGKPVLVTFDGHLDTRANVEGGKEMLVVDKMDRAWPGQTCNSTSAPAHLESASWKLIELNGNPYKSGAPGPEPHLTFDLQNKRVSGATGCNNLNGGYQQQGEKLTFGRLATTRRFCQESAALEKAFLDMLSSVTAFKIVGNKLNLYAGDKPLARFEAAR